MKKVFWVSVLILCFFTSVLGYELVKNPGKPVSANAGRSYVLKKILEITADSEDYYFRNLHRLAVSPDHHLYVLSDDQLLRFSPEGKFLNNIIKKGQGPGETTNVTEFLVMGNNRVMLQDHAPNKVVVLSNQSEIIHEKRLNSSNFFFLTHQTPDYYYFWMEKFPQTNGKALLASVDNQLQRYSVKEDKLSLLMAFPVKNFFYYSNNSLSMMILTNRMTQPLDHRRMWLCHTQEYNLKLLDLEKGAIIIETSRDYQRFPATGELKEYADPGAMPLNGKWVSPPENPYFNDIQGLVQSGAHLWVFTSTVDKEKGVLVDVFDDKGKYVDCFYLKFQDSFIPYKIRHRFLALDGNILYNVEYTEKKDLKIVKYQIPES